MFHLEPKTILASWIQDVKDNQFDSVQVAHFGSLNQDLVNSLTLSVEDFMISTGDHKTLVKHVFSILTEGLQNILIYGKKWDNELQSLIVLAYNDQAYRIVLGNLTEFSEKEKLTTYLDCLNTMEEEEMKAFYKETLNNGLISDKGGAGLGFIIMRMKSKSKLNYHFVPVSDDLMLFTISTDISRAQ
ncbi:DUF6272 family protein [Fluviicola sp.]|jgi:hypothetical protein|uniref:DUF6272 family protein n=1 Tax=Fluviicola sp. TaxID=1917219 RepID=UPI00281C08BC|nr:DUF6272 family protein [Fluviicola sp.]MDR0803110.1 SiaB family protein kinase [Fluviicola sp.]